MESHQTELELINKHLMEPLRELLSSDDGVERLVATGRQQITIPGLFSNQTITINALAAALALAALLLLGLYLFFGLTLFDVMDAMAGNTGYGGYGAPDTGYGAPSSGYGAPSSGYSAPAAGYNSRNDLVELTPEQKALYPELTQLQEQLRSVQDAEFKLRQHIVYQESEPDLTPGVGQIGYNY